MKIFPDYVMNHENCFCGEEEKHMVFCPFCGTILEENLPADSLRRGEVYLDYFKQVRISKIFLSS